MHNIWAFKKSYTGKFVRVLTHPRFLLEWDILFDQMHFVLTEDKRYVWNVLYVNKMKLKWNLQLLAFSKFWCTGCGGNTIHILNFQLCVANKLRQWQWCLHLANDLLFFRRLLSSDVVWADEYRVFVVETFLKNSEFIITTQRAYLTNYM